MGESFVDLQVNGYAGVDFNGDDLQADALHACCRRLRDDGVAAILATVITDDVEKMAARLRRLVELRAADPLAAAVIAGLHVEGPFLSPMDGYRGAHPREAIQPGDVDVMRRLRDAGGGLVKLVTLAPEQDAAGAVTRLLAREGVLVAGGHSNASNDQLRAAVNAGMTLWTHLGNGCPMMMHRHDNIIQRVLAFAARGAIRPTFIADGVHVPLPALGNYLTLAGDGAIIVTDAMAAAGLGPGTYRLGHWEVAVDESLAAWAPDRSHLVGSAGTMRRSAENLARVGLPAAQIDKLCRTNAVDLLRLT